MLARVSIIQKDQTVSQGNEVDCLTFTSKSGGITSAINVKILKCFAILQLFHRYLGGGRGNPNADCGWSPEQIRSKFFYINSKDHNWRVCLGILYALILLQVRDTLEQNGGVDNSKELMIVYKCIN